MNLFWKEMAIIKKPAVVYSCVFVIVFCWGYFLIGGMSFFWDDWGQLFDNGGKPRVMSLPELCENYLRPLFSGRDLFCLSNHTRPLSTWTAVLLPAKMFGTNVELYHIVKCIFLGAGAAAIFWIVRKMTNIYFAVSSVFLYVTSRAVFSVLYHVINEMFYSQVIFLLSILLFAWYFIHYTQIKPWVKVLCVIGILFLLKHAMLIAPDGRYFFLPLFLFLVLQGKTQFKRHFILWLSVFLISFPWLGLLKYVFFDRSFKFINTEGTNTIGNVFMAFKNYPFLINAFTPPMVLLFGLLIILALILGISKIRKIKILFTAEHESHKNLLAWTMFAFVWFAITFAMGLGNRGLGVPVNAPYSPTHYNHYELSYCAAPFVIFLSLLSFCVINNFSGRTKNILTKFVFLLIALGILNQGYRLNQYRGGWGECWNGWANAGRYIEANFDNSITFGSMIPFDYPFKFLHSDNKIIVDFGTDLDYVFKKSDGYKDVFVVTRGSAKFVNSSEGLELKDTRIFNGETNGPYETFKRLIGRGFKEKMCLYHFVRVDSKLKE